MFVDSVEVSRARRNAVKSDAVPIRKEQFLVSVRSDVPGQIHIVAIRCPDTERPADRVIGSIDPRDRI
jgi:hypothetical protein